MRPASYRFAPMMMSVCLALFALADAISSEDYFEQTEPDETIRQLPEVEAAKMLEQAAQYEKMGTRKTVRAAIFLYYEIIRRYPGTPQAEIADARLKEVKVADESWRSRERQPKNINPFAFPKDPEPPWITPNFKADSNYPWRPEEKTRNPEADEQRAAFLLAMTFMCTDMSLLSNSGLVWEMYKSIEKKYPDTAQGKYSQRKTELFESPDSDKPVSPDRIFENREKANPYQIPPPDYSQPPYCPQMPPYPEVQYDIVPFIMPL